MSTHPVIRNAKLVYATDRHVERDRFQVLFSELDGLRMCDIPLFRTLEVVGIPLPSDALSSEVFACNTGSDPEVSLLNVEGHVSFKTTPALRHRLITRLRRAFPVLAPPYGVGYLPDNPSISTHRVDDGVIVRVSMRLYYTDRRAILARDAVLPFVESCRRAMQPGVYAFICHASEDKPAARELAAAIRNLGTDVWFDEWEIRVGQSIVQKINEALGTVTHLVVLLPSASVTKPWVQKELSVALMRQLSQQQISVLPVRLDECQIPPILADVRYADARQGINHALADLENAFFAACTDDDA